MRTVPLLIVGSFSLSAIAADASTTSCNTVAACVMGTNSSSGPGIGGTSSSGFGVSGISTSGHGVNGTSSSSFGVVGITTENATSTGTARAGVLGEDSSTNKKAFNSGVAGSSTYGYGGSFTSTDGIGLFASSAVIAGLTIDNNTEDAETDTGTVLHSASLTSIIGADDGIDALPSGGVNTNPEKGGNSANSAVRAYGNYPAYGGGIDNVFVGVGCQAYISIDCNDVASIDAYGDAIFAGSITMNSSPNVRTKSSTGSDVASFGARTAAPSIEDIGKALLRNGSAYIALDHTFASTIDPHVAYSVFITPEGDSNSLYTTQLTQSGFAVRESKGGRSSLTFDYRIVAKPLDAKPMHLPAMSMFRQLAKHTAIPRSILKRSK